jgi:hypothetical protein
MIACYFGKFGQGKTLAMTEYLISQLNEGRVVYTNYHINWNNENIPQNYLHKIIREIAGKKHISFPSTNLRYFDDIEQFIEMENAVVALDEGWVYFDSYQMAKFPKHIRLKLMQSRKDGLDLVYTTQRIMNIHTNLREMTNVFYECIKKEPFFFKEPVFIRIERELTGEPIDRKDDDPRQIIFANQEMYNMFDTYQKIGESPSKEKLSDQQQPKLIEPIDTKTKQLPTVDFKHELSTVIHHEIQKPKRQPSHVLDLSGIRSKQKKFLKIQKIVS